MNKNEQPGYALITGATSGLGYEFCKLFAADGYNIILVARSDKRLMEVSDELSKEFGIKTITIAKDLFHPKAAREIYDEVNNMNVNVTALVNNAGQGEYGPFLETDLERETDLIYLNIVSLVSMTKYFARDMAYYDEGKILQVAALGVEHPSSYMAVYTASKSFVLSFSESLANELRDTNVTVTVLQPTNTDTDFYYKAGYNNVTGNHLNELADPVEVAKEGYDALMSGRHKIVAGYKNTMRNVSSALPASLRTGSDKQNPETQNAFRKQSAHTASQKEREMINNSPGEKYKKRDLAPPSLMEAKET